MRLKYGRNPRRDAPRGGRGSMRGPPGVFLADSNAPSPAAAPPTCKSRESERARERERTGYEPFDLQTKHVRRCSLVDRKPVIDSELVGSTYLWDGYHESRRCSRDTTQNHIAPSMLVHEETPSIRPMRVRSKREQLQEIIARFHPEARTRIWS